MILSRAMPALPLDSLPEAANLDDEFRLAARLWSVTLQLESDGEAQRLRIEDGRIVSVEPGPGNADVCIRGPADGWTRLLEREPRPFYQDLWGALAHHGFELSGDLARFHPWYPAVRRLVELLREPRSR